MHPTLSDWPGPRSKALLPQILASSCFSKSGRGGFARFPRLRSAVEGISGHVGSRACRERAGMVQPPRELRGVLRGRGTQLVRVADDPDFFLGRRNRGSFAWRSASRPRNLRPDPWLRVVSSLNSIDRAIAASIELERRPRLTPATGSPTASSSALKTRPAGLFPRSISTTTPTLTRPLPLYQQSHRRRGSR